MTPPRTRAEVAHDLTPRGPVVSRCRAAKACGVSRDRLATMLANAGLAAHRLDGDVTVTDVLAAVAWAWDHETVNAAAKRHGMPAKTMERILVAHGLIVTWHTGGGAGWHAVARRDVDEAVREHRPEARS